LCLSASSPSRPLQHVFDDGLSYGDDLAVEASDLVAAESYERVCLGTVAQPDPGGLASLIERWAAGRLRTWVAGVLPLERAAEAHRRLAAGQVRGKLVLTP
jgi:NADPH:quinone reductase-like Zn-dependent oxidoreductase